MGITMAGATQQDHLTKGATRMKKNVLYFLLVFVIGTSCLSASTIEEKQFVVIIPSYNNEHWVRKNLNSILTQKYSNFKIIYIDDCSSDNTYQIVSQYRKRSPDKIKVIRNQQNQGALKNIYEAIHTCEDNEIIVLVDGDDWLYDTKVLKRLNRYYSNPKKPIWLTYGSYINFPAGNQDINREYSQHSIISNKFREDIHPSHLRTFYAWLFKKIKKEDLMYNDEFYSMTWDLAMMFPMIEMCGERFKYIRETTYVYNQANPISDHRKDRAYQEKLANYIKCQPPYKKLEIN